MEPPVLDLVIDLKNLKSFKKKAFRDSYVSGRVRTSIALQIRELRQRLGLTQKEFAKKIGKGQTAVSRLESTDYGRVTVQTLLDIAETLNIAVVVRFASFDEFLRHHSDLTPAALAVETYNQTIERFAMLATLATLQPFATEPIVVPPRAVSASEGPYITKSGVDYYVGSTSGLVIVFEQTKQSVDA